MSLFSPLFARGSWRSTQHGRLREAITLPVATFAYFPGGKKLDLLVLSLTCVSAAWLGIS